MVAAMVVVNSAVVGAAAGTTATVATATITTAGGTTAVVTAASLAALSILTAGAVVVGALNNEEAWDCWKPVVHDTSTPPSNGISLRDLVQHPNIDIVAEYPDSDSFKIRNIFGEEFGLISVKLQDAGCAFHAVRTHSL